MFYPLVLGSQNSIDWFIVFMCPVIVYFWVVLRKGINKPWEPILFIIFGLFEPITFCVELFLFFRNYIVRIGIQVLCEIHDSNDMLWSWTWAVVAAAAAATAGA